VLWFTNQLNTHFPLKDWTTYFPRNTCLFNNINKLLRTYKDVQTLSTWELANSTRRNLYDNPQSSQDSDWAVFGMGAVRFGTNDADQILSIKG
jgi:hypothetical protein